MNLASKILISIALIIVASPCYAYIGPGLGAGTLAAILGFIFSIFLAIVGVVYYPIKRLYRKLRKTKRADKQVKSK